MVSFASRVGLGFNTPSPIKKVIRFCVSIVGSILIIGNQMYNEEEKNVWMRAYCAVLTRDSSNINDCRGMAKDVAKEAVENFKKYFYGGGKDEA
jgi:hypothetical protein